MQEEEIVSDAIMKMLFPPNDGAKVKEVRKKLCDAGIRCRVKKLALTEGLFGIPPYPETQAYVKKTMQYARDIGA